MSYIGKSPAATVSEITDNTIVDADINASAAITMSKVNLSITNNEVNASAGIVGSKISPDFGAQDITTTGKNYFANVFTNESDLTTTLATTYHGMFAHAHDTTKAYFSHNNAWHALAKESDAVLLAGTQTVTGVKTFSAPARGTVTAHDSGTNYNLATSNNFSTTITTGSPALQFTTDGTTTTLTSGFVGQSGNIYLNNTGATFSKGTNILCDSDLIATINVSGVYWLSYVVIESSTGVYKALVVNSQKLT